MVAIRFKPIFLHILKHSFSNVLKHQKSGESQNIILTLIPSLLSYVSNIIGLICDCFLLRFDVFFWNEIDKKYANLEEPDPYSLSILHFE